MNASTSVDSNTKKSILDFEVINIGNGLFGSDLGKGSFGKVRLVKDKNNPDKLYALKIVFVSRNLFNYPLD